MAKCESSVMPTQIPKTKTKWEEKNGEIKTKDKDTTA